MESEYYIWSIEHNAWWRSDREGYTPHLFLAGLYGQEEAAAIVESANEHGTFNECMIPKDFFV